jgi:galactofuranosylgalactofuranosylrhamnosyl-N-acetylglucosaminyl-diphospho-decaprenol beta-1,5/1,6-galactofuranosyltransferase
MLRTPESTAPAVDPSTADGQVLGGPDALVAAGVGGSDREARRRVVQRGLFFGPSALVPEDLYAQVEQGVARRERARVRLQPGSRVTTNTYFGRFPATYWQRWTTVSEVEVELVAAGSGRVRLMASDTNKVWRIVAAAEVRDSAPRTLRLTARLDRFIDGGGLWIDLGTEDGELTVCEVAWTVTEPAVTRPTSVVICTYNRVEDCLNTLTAMADDPEALAVVHTVHVVDQGSDPIDSRPRFADVAARFGSRLHHVRQPNLGGAGGFTRGIYECTSGAPGDDHDVLLMDDDVQLEPEILVRLTGFAAHTAHPTIVGGQMLNLLHPAHLHRSAEYADPERMLSGLVVPGAMAEAYLLGRDERELPVVQDRRVDTVYNGWWSCLVPAAIVRAIGYPLPLFFQWDDVEYGYRARAHGFPTVALPGAGVWHADFGWKDWDEWHRYFNLRNGLIMAALHTGFSVKRIRARFVELLATNLVSMHYGLAATLLHAVEDFLAGPEILHDGSAAAAAEIRRIRAGYAETVMHPIAEVVADFPDFLEVEVRPVANEPGRMLLTWAKRVAHLATGRSVHATGYVPAGDAHWWHVSLFERAVVTDMSEQGYRVRTRDRKLAWELATRGATLVRRLSAEGPAVARRYRDAAPRLTSRENWARLYGLDDA